MAQLTTQVAADGATVIVREIEANIVELIAPAQPAVVEVITAGPAGAPGIGIPIGGQVGNILIKSGTANYESEWAPTLDGGTFN